MRLRLVSRPAHFPGGCRAGRARSWLGWAAATPARRAAWHCICFLGLADSLTAKPASLPVRPVRPVTGQATDRAHHGRAAAARALSVPGRKSGPDRAPGNCVQEAGSTPASADRCCHRIEREARPPMRCAGRRGRPPQLERQYGRWLIALLCAIAVPALVCCRIAAMPYSERCCGIPARRARTSVSRYRRCPPSVRIDVSFPAFAHLVTVFGSTLNIVATSAGVSSGSASGVRADILTASPPGPVLRSLPTSLAVRGF